MKKLLLTLGTLSAIVAPITAVVACSEDAPKVDPELKVGIEKDTKIIQASEGTQEAKDKAIQELNKATHFADLSKIVENFKKGVSDLAEAAANAKALEEGKVIMGPVDGGFAVTVYSMFNKEKISALTINEVKIALKQGDISLMNTDEDRADTTKQKAIWVLLGIKYNKDLAGLTGKFEDWNKDDLILTVGLDDSGVHNDITVTIIPKA